MTEKMVCHFDGPQPYASDFTGDHTGHLGQVATEVGSPAFRAGKFGKGLDISPGNYITYASELVEAAGAVVLWFNPDDLFAGAVKTIFSDSSSAFDISTNGGEWAVKIGDYVASSSGETIVTGTWYHLALTWDGGACAFYLNGSLLLSGTKTTWGVGGTVNVGNIVGKGSDGAIDELIICDHAPLANAIRSYYNDGVMRLVGENESINLLDPDGFYLTRDGWRPQVATADALGGYTDEVEKMRLEWKPATDDLRAPFIQAMERIFANARRRDPRNDPNSFVPAYLEVRGHNESEMRYALVRDGEVGALNARHWGPARPVDAAIELSREGAWRAVLPRANGVPWPVVVAQTIFNKEDADGNNEVTITADDVPGDADALMDITIEMDSGDEILRGMVAMRKGDTSYLDAFHSHYNAADDESAATPTADSDAPADFKIAVAAGGSPPVTSTLYWTIPIADMHGYDDNFNVYIGAWASFDNDDTVAYMYTLGTQSDSPVIPAKHAGASSAIAPWLLAGTVSLPPGAYIPDLTYDGEQRLFLSITADGSGNTVNFYNISLVPTKDGVFAWQARHAGSTPGIPAGYPDVVEIAGRFEKAYSLTTVGTLEGLAAYGRFLTLSPSDSNRLYFYFTQHWTPSDNDPEHYMPNASVDVTVKIVPRYLALRGVS